MLTDIENWRNARFPAETASEGGTRPDSRTHSQRDRDRILYSSVFRRLAGITQVTSPTASGSGHNRLTHALKVAQVGRRMAENLLRNFPALNPAQATDPLICIDPDVVEAAGLAHDLGHPPFGHVAEEALNELALSHGCQDGFEGNAQSFRIVVALEVGAAPHDTGLGLTRATLNSLLKYPEMRKLDGALRQKFGAYRSEQGVFDWSRRQQCPRSKTLEAQIMDWADDITYAAHDLEDFYRRNAIPTDRLATDKKEQELLSEGMFRRGKITISQGKEYTDLLARIAPSLLPKEKYAGKIAQRKTVRALVSFWIARWINATTIENGVLKMDPPSVASEVLLVQQLTWQYVIEDPTLRALQKYQIRMVRRVFDALEETRKKESLDKSREGAGASEFGLIPPSYIERIQEAETEPEKTRAILDLVASMGEEQVSNTHTAISDVHWTLA